MKRNDVSIIIIITMLVSFIVGAVYSYIILLEEVNTENSIVKSSTSITFSEDETIAKGISNIYDAVVVIEGYGDKNKISTGTGFVYKKDKDSYYVMTNHHVINNCDDIKVILSDKTELDATLMGSESYSDVAVLRVKGDSIKQVANIGKSEDLKVGDVLFTVGSPSGVDYAGTVTKGILSGKDRLVEVALNGSNSSDYYMKVIQTDAAINPGNSGGPICNNNGDVVGITNMKLVDGSIEGMGFAIPIEDALIYASVFEKGEKIKRPYVGISMLDIRDSYHLWENNISVSSNIKNGVVIVEVVKDSPAKKVGLKKGDVIVKIGNKKIKSLAEFRYELYKYNVDDEMPITYVRKNKKIDVNIKLSEKPDDN